ncbi:hypothetical protein PFFCH_05588 [Plasmodium falciparum FCH/4]|uniref:Uncharacterized protein n=1 Tax=Plasmodium falciparum FCH/4 TaxID=1036724 RepID=A0A024VEQ9_PLAFA|nr:hypothetical protein PFFCH_05588 [Plasmodium falciparum FCH/4]
MFVGKTKRELNQTCQNKFEGAISVDNNVNIYCKNKLDEYRNWDVHRKNQWDGSKENYKKHKENNGFSGKQPNEQNTKAYVKKKKKKKCKEFHCDINNLENMHKKLENADLNTIKTIVQEVKTKKNYTCTITKKKK